MTTQTVVVEPTALRCHARHPSASSNNALVSRRFQDRIHGAVLIDLPFRARPTGRLFKEVGETRVGCIPAYCVQCQVYTEYEVVAPAPETLSAVPAEARR